MMFSDRLGLKGGIGEGILKVNNERFDFCVDRRRRPIDYYGLSQPGMTCEGGEKRLFPGRPLG